jgi:DNA-binding transcriptional regulator YbjK
MSMTATASPTLRKPRRRDRLVHAAPAAHDERGVGHRAVHERALAELELIAGIVEHG